MIKLREIKIDALNDSVEELEKSILKKLKIKKEELIDYKIIKKSIDARDKNKILFIYEVDISVLQQDKVLKNNKNILKVIDSNYEYSINGKLKYNNRIVIVGSGPSGLFCAYLLALNGYKPLVIERGEDIKDRINTVNKFWNDNILNENSNIQFGLGGAGTFSDGKLNTLVKDKNNRMKFVYETFVEMGASSNILYDYKPHVGTDVLSKVVSNLKDKIISLGGEFLFNTTLTNIIVNNNRISKIEVNNKQLIDTDILVLAIGHSSRDTIRMLSNYLDMKPKGFAVGFRIIHNQDMINYSQYGSKYKDILGPATYKLTYKSSNNRGVYTFCMCPGGYVVNASSNKNMLAVNGMSYSDRGSSTSNSGLVVTVLPKDFNNSLFGGLEFQEKIEKEAYKIASGKMPVQLLEDYYNNKVSASFKSVIPNIKGEYKFANLNSILPKEFNDAIKEALPNLGRKIKGFDNPDTVLVGVESRTSSAIKIERDDNLEANIKGIYPIGEGSGNSGGITTSAIDGMKAFESIINIYKNNC